MRHLTSIIIATGTQTLIHTASRNDQVGSTLRVRLHVKVCARHEQLTPLFVPLAVAAPDGCLQGSLPITFDEYFQAIKMANMDVQGRNPFDDYRASHSY